MVSFPAQRGNASAQWGVMSCSIAGASRIGQRADNEDRYGWRVDDARTCIAVADGMGGHPRGKLAADIAVETVLRGLEPVRACGESALVEAVAAAHRAVVDAGRRCRPPVDPCTTLVVVWLEDAQARWAHVGDSRLYWFQRGRIAFRTRDHNAAEALYEQGRISARERLHHPMRNWVDRCLGGDPEPPAVEVGPVVTLAPGDRLLLCSDGLTVLDDDRITAEACAEGALQDIADRLAEQAEHAGAPCSDNVTVVLCEYRR